MSLLPIVKYPDPRLAQTASDVTKFDARISKLIDSMFETMYEAGGIGLAGPQIGTLERIVVVDISRESSAPLEVINPEIIESDGSVPSEEGCLSIPGFRETLTRSKNVVVRYQDRTGALHEISADGLMAICLQHEIDHLNGVLFVDRLSRLKREIFKKWFEKNRPLE